MDDKIIKEIFELYEEQAIDTNLKIIIKTLKEWYFEKALYKLRIENVLKILKNEDGSIPDYKIIEDAIKELERI